MNVFGGGLASTKNVFGETLVSPNTFNYSYSVATPLRVRYASEIDLRMQR